MKHADLVTDARNAMNEWVDTLSSIAYEKLPKNYSKLLSNYAENWAAFADAHPQQAEEFLRVRAVTLELSSNIDLTTT